MITVRVKQFVQLGKTKAGRRKPSLVKTSDGGREEHHSVHRYSNTSLSSSLVIPLTVLFILQDINNLFQQVYFPILLLLQLVVLNINFVLYSSFLSYKTIKNLQYFLCHDCYPCPCSNLYIVYILQSTCYQCYHYSFILNLSLYSSI